MQGCFPTVIHCKTTRFTFKRVCIYELSIGDTYKCVGIQGGSCWPSRGRLRSPSLEEDVRFHYKDAFPASSQNSMSCEAVKSATTDDKVCWAISSFSADKSTGSDGAMSVELQNRRERVAP